MLPFLVNAVHSHILAANVSSSTFTRKHQACLIEFIIIAFGTSMSVLTHA